MKRFTATVTRDVKKRVVVVLPFDPDEAWGAKPRHPLTGSFAGHKLRASAERTEGGWAIRLGPAWLRDCGVEVGERGELELRPEGPQRAALAPDVAEALAAEPEAAAFFDGLAQFYRKAYLRHIDATSGRPEVRKERIAEVVALLRSGQKERPKR